MQKALTPDEVRDAFRQRGETFTAWARKHGWKVKAVYRVLNGADKGHFGQAHDIAVALGLKVAAKKGSSHDVACNTHERAVA